MCVHGQVPRKGPQVLRKSALVDVQIGQQFLLEIGHVAQNDLKQIESLNSLEAELVRIGVLHIVEGARDGLHEHLTRHDFDLKLGWTGDRVTCSSHFFNWVHSRDDERR